MAGLPEAPMSIRRFYIRWAKPAPGPIEAVLSNHDSVFAVWGGEVQSGGTVWRRYSVGWIGTALGRYSLKIQVAVPAREEEKYCLWWCCHWEWSRSQAVMVEFRSGVLGQKVQNSHSHSHSHTQKPGIWSKKVGKFEVTYFQDSQTKTFRQDSPVVTSPK